MTQFVLLFAMSATTGVSSCSGGSCAPTGYSYAAPAAYASGYAANPYAYTYPTQAAYTPQAVAPQWGYAPQPSYYYPQPAYTPQPVVAPAPAPMQYAAGYSGYAANCAGGSCYRR